MTNNPLPDNSTDSQNILNQIVLEHIRGQKRKRIWQWVKRGIVLLGLLGLFYQWFVMHVDEVSSRTKPHVALIKLKGGIFEGQQADSDNFMKGLNSAYENHKALKAVILRIDSPGGSPVQADYMYNSIQFYKKKYPDIKIYAVCVDMCASAAYYVAAAADEIYANPSSLVGSIGVLYNGFGFVDAMQKLGVTRRLHTAGINKGFLDQFTPENPAQEQLLQTMLDLIHQQFIDRVKAGRGQRWVIDKDTFSGLFWTGIQAKERGLIDGFASSGQVARDIIKIDRVVDYTFQESVIERVSKQMGTAIANQLPLALGMKPGIY